jgi:hypothetical protein
MALLSDKTPCPALYQEGDGKYSCAFVSFERDMGVEPLIAESLGIGKGCTYNCEFVELEQHGQIALSIDC